MTEQALATAVAKAEAECSARATTPALFRTWVAVDRPAPKAIAVRRAARARQATPEALAAGRAQVAAEADAGAGSLVAPQREVVAVDQGALR